MADDRGPPFSELHPRTLTDKERAEDAAAHAAIPSMSDVALAAARDETLMVMGEPMGPTAQEREQAFLDALDAELARRRAAR